jgi:hypothetical protein
MVRMFLIFLLLTVFIGGGIHVVRQLSGMEKWQLTKLLVYSVVCAMLALGALTVFVLLF